MTLTLNSLKSIVKKRVLELYPDNFEIAIKHPDPEYRCPEDTKFYYVKISYVTTDKLKEMFGGHFKINNIPMDFRKLDTWAELFFLLQYRAEYKKNGKAITQENFKLQEEAKKELQKELQEAIKNLPVKLKLEKSTFIGVDFYTQVYSVNNSNLEIRTGSVRPNRYMHDTVRYTNLTRCWGTFAIAAKKGFRDVELLETGLTLETLAEKLKGYINQAEYKGRRAA